MAKSPAKAPTALLVLAFGSIYIVWGTTFYAIRMAVLELPPFFAAGSRFLFAGIFLYAFIRLRGTDPPTQLQWRNLATVGGLMFVADYAALFWAERLVPSGVASVLASTIPLLTVLLSALVLRRQRLDVRSALASLLGLAGVSILLLPGTHTAIPFLPCLAILAGCTAWALGGLLNNSLALPSSKVLTSGASMMVGGAGLFVLSAVSGELHPFPHITLRAALALAYLTVFGSILGFTAYVWLLGRIGATQVNSYALVNPIVAVAVGYFLAAEPVNLHMLLAVALILVSVYLILSRPAATNRSR